MLGDDNKQRDGERGAKKRRDVVVEIGGRRLAGSYAVASGRIYVRYGERAKAMQIGVSTPELLARSIIIEIAGETK